jgi:tRNA threonylcarbamoyladenosine biosynthesis protein TsaE
MKINFVSISLADYPDIASAILSAYQDIKYFVFYGDLGAGKTTLIKSLCKVLAYEGDVTSPTFSIVNEYIGKNHPIFHMDLYRLKSQDEILDIGIEDYIEQDAYIFAEWPQLLIPLLPEPYCKVTISLDTHQNRKIETNLIHLLYQNP